MAVTELYNIKKEKIGEIELNDSLFRVTVNSHILHDIVRMQLANRRTGTASTKTRAEVRGSSAKPWRQKGTGRARSGHRRSPLWRGGGTVFGPKPRSYAYNLPKKVRKLGLRMALSSRFEEGLLTVLDDFKIDEIKTRTFVDIMGVLGIKNGLIVTSAQNEQLEKSSRNVPGFKVLSSNGLNVYDILLYEHIILAQSCISQLEERLLS